MSDTDLVLAYQLDMRRRGLQPTTVARTAAFIRFFVNDTGTRSLLKVEPDDIEQFLDHRPRLIPKTRYTYLSYLHGFYEFLVRAGYNTTDPTVMIQRPRIRRGLPRPASNADLEIALGMAPPRTRAIIALGAFTGLRCIEIARLTREDIWDHEEPATILVHGKGDKERRVPLHPDVWLSLQTYGLPRTGPVFRLKCGRPCSNWNISQEGNRYFAQLGVDTRMHRLRHWFGTHTYRTSNHDLLLVADLMGHSSTVTTMIYAGFDRDGADDAVRALTTKTVH